MSVWRFTACVSLVACVAPRVQTSPPGNDPAKATSRGASIIRIREFAFVPPELTISAGDAIEWVNQDAFTHTTTADSAAWSSPEMPEGGRFIFTSKRPGRFSYHCAAHASMRGMIVVQ
jgi:plastocyanin